MSVPELNARLAADEANLETLVDILLDMTSIYPAWSE